MAQLDLFSYFNKPAAVPAKPAPPSKPYSISRDPLAGYRVVLAPGITSKAPQNPCINCPHEEFWGKDACSGNCARAREREEYLSFIGAPLVAAVSADGAYDFGN